ncbi:methyltransferase family protein [[Mycobacterium] vasticus]|uniref:Isoprenylcysteine carboxylmethyltransferase family protein n=1 Tax=[Mycobacterium] vasticus TaxID=2875777 RepID=A0ABU5Z207_9MYCO|nr:isoprenylcysteine carboxylmethyltransferase family protein [Mycolicibacter sp. MYC017]MEB3071421.1 isoprenylcysteine carboxylmethyltransferase family protein [Mycolicibacter sp. MYC017]
MAATAIALYVSFAALGFGWRSWLQYRRTGSSGFRGVSGELGSVEWLAGVGFVVSIIAGFAAPVLQLVGAVSPIPVLNMPWLQAIGTVVAVAGIAATLYSQRDMGESWRIGVDVGETTTLVRHGVFALVRNPIYTAMLAFAAGITLMAPNPLALVAFAVLLATIELQVRVVEEPYLARVHGDAYRDYCRATGRFLPAVGRAR